MSNVQTLNHPIVSLQEIIVRSSFVTFEKNLIKLELELEYNGRQDPWEEDKYYQEKLAISIHSVKVLRKRRETVEGE